MYRIKDLLRMKTNKKVKIVCLHVISYIHCHKEIFLGDHNHVSRYKSYLWMETRWNRWEIFSFGFMPRLNITDLAKAKHDLSFSDIRIGAFEPSLYGTIIDADLTLLVYVK